MFIKHIARLMYGSGYLMDEADGLSDLAALGDDDKSDDKDDDKEEDDKDDKSDDDDSDESSDDKEDDDEDKSDDEDKEDEDEDEDKSDDEDEEDDEEDEENDAVLHVADIKKYDPKFLKKFPEVRAALYRDQQYGELFGSPKDAESVVQNSNALQAIEKELMVDGDASRLLGEIKKGNAESYEKVIFGILPYLQENDKDTYYEIAAVPIKQMLRSIFRKHGKDSNVGKAAQYIHQEFFDNLNFDEKVKGEGKKEEKISAAQKEYEERIKKIDEREYSTFNNSVQTSYISKMTKEFRSGIENDSRLSEWAKTKLIEDGLISIRKELDADSRYQRSMTSLWNQAKAAGYSNDFKSRIVNAALARAKSLVPNTRKRLLAEAVGKSKSKDKKEEKQTDRKVTNINRDKRDDKGDKKKDQSKKPVTDLDFLKGTA